VGDGSSKHVFTQIKAYNKKGGNFVADSNKAVGTAVEEASIKDLSPREKKDLAIYPLAELAGGIYKAYFSTYISLLMTSVYIFPIAIAGVLETIQAATQWFASPIMGVVYDRTSFKKSKYWPWWLITGCGAGLAYIMVFALPVFSADPTTLAIPAAFFIALSSFLAAGNSTLGVTLFAYFGKNEKLRAYLSMASKFTRDGMKVVVGLIFPLMLVALTDGGMSDVNAWAIIAVVLAGAAIIGFFVTGILTKNSAPEKEAVEGKVIARKKKSKLSDTIKYMLTNRALLVCFVAMSLGKVFFFFHITGGGLFWRHYMNSMTMMAVWSTAISLSAIVGVLLMPIFLKIFKDNKICFVVAIAIQTVIYFISTFIVSPENPIGTIAIISAASFFNGVSDGFIVPMFAGAADYTAWKSGNKDYGLTMSVYSISVRVGSVGSIAIRTALLAAAGFNSAALAAGEAVPEAVMQVFRNYNTTYPMILCAVIALLVFFVYPLNDKKVAQYRAEIAERDKQAAEA